MRALTDYLHNSHGYFLDFRLPAIRRKLIEAVDCSQSDVSFAIMRFFSTNTWPRSSGIWITRRRGFSLCGVAARGGEEHDLLDGDLSAGSTTRWTRKLRELKNIIIKYYPSGSTNQLNGVLFDIFTCEQEPASHNAVEDEIFIPAVERLAATGPADGETRTVEHAEKEIIVCVVKGMTNKQIADALCISAHTVITHRRNIAAKRRSTRRRV